MRVRRVSVAIALLAGGVVPPAQAAPTWLAPVTVSGVNDVSSVELAVAPQGEVMVAWAENATGIHFATRPPGGSFTTVLQGVQGLSQQVAYDPSGNALAIWAEASNIKAAFKPAGGSFGDPVPISTAGPGETNTQPRVVFDSQGNALAAWFHFDGTNVRVQAAFRAAGGSFGTPDFISAEGAHSHNIAFGGNGDAIAVWIRSGRTEAAVRPAGGSFGTAVPISAAGQEVGGGSPDIGLDRDGNAIAVWVRPETAGGLARAQASFRPAGGTFQAIPDTLSPTGGFVGAETPHVAFDSQGNAVVTWMRQFWIEVAARPAGGSFGESRRISPVDNNAWSPRIAFDPGDDALVVWQNQGGSKLVTAFSIRPAGGSFSIPFQPISESPTYFYSQRLAIDGQGNAVAAWLRTVDGKYRAEVAGYDAAPPVLGNVSLPAGGRAGEALAFSAAPLDVWSPVTTSWDFGDGSTAGGTSTTHTYAGPGSFAARLTATDAVGNASSTSRTLAIGPAADTLSPVLSALRLVPTRFRVAARASAGTSIRFTLSEAARVAIRVQRARPGRRVRGRCRRPTRQNRRRPPCRRWVTLRGGITHNGRAGANRRRFSGRLGRRALTPGVYRLVARPTDAAGNRGRARTAAFKVLRPR